MGNLDFTKKLETEVIAFCRERFGKRIRWKTPTSVVILEELPKNRAGKVHKEDLRILARQRQREC